MRMSEVGCCLALEELVCEFLGRAVAPVEEDDGVRMGMALFGADDVRLVGGHGVCG